IFVGPAANFIAIAVSFINTAFGIVVLWCRYSTVHGHREAIQRAALKSSDDRLRWVFKTRHSLRPLSHDRDEPHMPSDACRRAATASDQRLVLGCHGEGGRQVCDPLRCERGAPYQ